MNSQQKAKAIELINEAKKLGEDMEDYDSSSKKYPRQAYEDLYYAAKELYCELINKPNDWPSNSMYWHYDGDWYFEAKNYTDELEKLLKNDKEKTN